MQPVDYMGGQAQRVIHAQRTTGLHCIRNVFSDGVPMDHTLKLLLVMVASGLLGGVVNFIYSYSNGRKKMVQFVDLLKSMITGVAAALLIPIFLNTISSNIVKESETDDGKLLVFAGFCVIAAVSSKAFIKAISGRVLERVNRIEEDVQAVKSEVKPMVLKHSEFDEAKRRKEKADGRNSPVQANSAGETVPDETKSIKVLEKLADSDYAFRSIEGLARDVNMEPEQVQECLEHCVSSGLAGQIENSLGVRFYITEDGQSHLLSYNGQNKEEPEDAQPAQQEYPQE
mgnify:FL=1